MPQRIHLRMQTTWTAIMDVVCLVAAGVIAVFMRVGSEELWGYLFRNMAGSVVFAGGVIIANYLAGSYRVQYTFSRFNLIVTWLFSLVFALLVVSVTSYGWLSFLLGRGVMALWLLWYSVFSLTLKIIVYQRIFRSEAFICRTVILGHGELGREIRRVIENRWVLPVHKVVAFVDPVEFSESGPGKTEIVDGVAMIKAGYGDIAAIVRSLGAQLLVPALPGADKKADILFPQIRRLRFEGVEALTPLNVFEIYCGRTPLDFVDEDTMTGISLESALPVSERLKRLMDIFGSLIALILTAPVMVAIAALMKASAPRLPVFYSQARAGRFGAPFRIYKFRTMIADAEHGTGPKWAAKGDSRITPIGRVLRKFRLDELPQFCNVLKGDMSLVGPRPERPEMVDGLAAEIPFYAERCNVTPGLTGWAQIRYPYGDSVEDARRKLEYDLYYIKHLSLSLDVQILLRTIRIMAFGKERAM